MSVPQSRVLHVNAPDFDRAGYDRVLGQHKERYQKNQFMQDQVEILHNLADNIPEKDEQYLNSVKPPTQQKLLDLESTWHPAWFALPLVNMINVFNKSIIRFDVPNIIHPQLRKIATPVAVVAAVASLAHTDKFCKDAGLDNLTRGYQVAATAGYQLFANYALPTLVFKTLTKAFATTKIGMGPRNNAVIYGAAAFTLLGSLASEKQLKFNIESYLMDHRLGRKDYGLAGQMYNDTSLKYDNHLVDWPEHFLIGPGYAGNQYTLSESVTEEKAITSLFPGFALAEATPTWEVPYNSDEFVTHSPAYAQSAMVDQAVEVEGQRKVPAPTENTQCRQCSTKWGEYSLANNYEHAYDKAFGFDWYLNKDDENAIERVRHFRTLYQLHEQKVKDIMFEKSQL